MHRARIMVPPPRSARGSPVLQTGVSTTFTKAALFLYKKVRARLVAIRLTIPF